MTDDRTAVRALLLLALVVLAVPTAGFAAAAQESPPATPASYYGQAFVNGEPAPAGVTVAAVVDGETVATMETGENGTFGGSAAFAEKLTVPEPDGGNGTTVSFTIAGEPAAETVAWESGDVRELTLTATGVSGPTAAIDAPSSATAGSAITFDASGSSAPLGIERFEWTFPDGSATGETTSYTFDSPGSYDVTLTVTDAQGNTDSATVTVRVEAASSGSSNSGTATPTDTPSEPVTATPAPNATNATNASELPPVVEEVTLNDSDPERPGKTVEFNRSRSVRSVTFDDENVSGTVQVREYNETPDSVQRDVNAQLGGNQGNGSNGDARVVSVVDISPSSPDAESSSATIELTIDRDEVDDPQNVFVAHEQSDGTWERLETTVTESSDGTVTVRAKTGSFSRFAVVEQEQATATPTATATDAPTDTATPTDTVTPTDTDTPVDSATEEETSVFGPSILGNGLAAVVIALTGVALLLRRRE